MPSYGEPFGMTILEAMASGVPVVTTNVGGPAYLVREQGGRAVPMQDAAQLASALIEVLSNTELQKSMGRYNRHQIEQEFDWRRSLDRMEGVYARVLGKGTDSSAQGTAEQWSA
jgi:glycosyltransferase involved in cell wall biosynthesis